MNRMDNFNTDDIFLSLLTSQRKLLMQIRIEEVGNCRQHAVSTSVHLSDQHTTTEKPRVSPSLEVAEDYHSYPENLLLSRDPSPLLNSLDNNDNHDHGSFISSPRHNFEDSHDSLLTFEPLHEFLYQPKPIRIQHPMYQHLQPSDHSTHGFFGGDLKPKRMHKLSSMNDHSSDPLDRELSRIRNSSPMQMLQCQTAACFGELLDDSKPNQARKCAFLGKKGDLDRKLSPQSNFVIEQKRLFIIEKAAEVDRKVKTLSEALEKSSKSQQEIQKWDRKMGLKRSHSKTMTMSMQSRKKLKKALHNYLAGISRR